MAIGSGSVRQCEKLPFAAPPLSSRRGGSQDNRFDMTDKVPATWYDVVSAQDVTEKDAETIKGAFVYEGFLQE
jgi:hypothetical protein